ncbi:MAG: hypothetical protein GY858_10375 [Candidatus Omnitrophica bacterium]|nr:hypothetical protein [Candidatus Omnitrophota bacterium]
MVSTNELDSETELKIQEAIDLYGKERTLLVIAQRLSTIRYANNIVVLNKGKVVEQGRHEELIRLQGRYYRLIQAQGKEENKTQSIFCGSQYVFDGKHTGYFNSKT